MTVTRIRVKKLFTGEILTVIKPSKIKYYKELAKRNSKNYKIVEENKSCEKCGGKGFI